MKKDEDLTLELYRALAPIIFEHKDGTFHLKGCRRDQHGDNDYKSPATQDCENIVAVWLEAGLRYNKICPTCGQSIPRTVELPAEESVDEHT